MDVRTAAGLALHRIALRVGLAGDGWVAWPEQPGAACSAMLPGGSVLEIDGNGVARLMTPARRLLGQGGIGDPGFLASLMHNCDAMIGREYGPGAVEVVRLADALADFGGTEVVEAVIEAVPGPDEPASVSAGRPSLATDPLLAGLADAADPTLRSAYIGWRSARLHPRRCAAWDDGASLVRWNGHVAAMTRQEEPVPSASGWWERIEGECGRVEAARSLGLVEGNLGSISEDRHLFALRMAGGPTGIGADAIVAVAAFEDGELASVTRSAAREARPRSGLSEDLVIVIRHVEALRHERGFGREEPSAPRM